MKEDYLQFYPTEMSKWNGERMLRTEPNLGAGNSQPFRRLTIIGRSVANFFRCNLPKKLVSLQQGIDICIMRDPVLVNITP